MHVGILSSQKFTVVFVSIIIFHYNHWFNWNALQGGNNDSTKKLNAASKPEWACLFSQPTNESPESPIDAPSSIMGAVRTRPGVEGCRHPVNLSPELKPEPVEDKPIEEQRSKK